MYASHFTTLFSGLKRKAARCMLHGALGLEGIVSKRFHSPYRSGPVKDVAQVEKSAV